MRPGGALRCGLYRLTTCRVLVRQIVSPYSSHLHVTKDLNVFNFILTREGSSDSIELNTFNLRAWKPVGRNVRPRLLRPTG